MMIDDRSCRKKFIRLYVKLSSIRASFVLAGAVIFAVLFGNSAHAQQTITLAIGTTAGGGYDLYGRLVARHLGRFLPGNPRVVPVNMPGAGQVVMTNWLSNVAPKDGTAIGLIPGTTAFENLFGNSNAHFDGRKFHWLASLNGYTTIAAVWHTSAIMRPEDFFSRESVLGGSGATSDVTIWPRLLNSILGTKIRLVTGYRGTAHLTLAIESGEVEGMIGADWDGLKLTKSDWIRDNKIRVVMQLVMQPHPDLRDVPTIMSSVPEETKPLVQLLLARQQYGRPFAAPPGISDAHSAALRNAFAEMLRDPEFRHEADLIKAVITPATGTEIAALVDQVYSSPKDLIDRASLELRKASN